MILAEKRNHKEEDEARHAPFDTERNAAATWYQTDQEKNLDSTMASILTNEVRPNAEQKLFLGHFMQRLKLEMVEQRQRSSGSTSHEPLLDIVHGFPGTGKSKIIAWMRELMEKGLGWNHGTQFVCLAFQNAMAAQINGFTIHHWSGIPARSIEGNTTGNRHEQSIKCQALRLVIIDELSMVAAELFGALEYVVKNAIRIQDTYKKRPDGSTRAFGGVNVAMFVDFWHLQPVSGTWFCANPLEIPAGRAQDALWMLWGSGPDTIRSHWELSEIMRCKDIWYNEFLHECRNRNLQKDMYSFFHGLPALMSRLSECPCTGGDNEIVADPI